MSIRDHLAFKVSSFYFSTDTTMTNCLIYWIVYDIYSLFDQFAHRLPLDSSRQLHSHSSLQPNGARNFLDEIIEPTITVLQRKVSFVIVLCNPHIRSLLEYFAIRAVDVVDATIDATAICSNRRVRMCERKKMNKVRMRRQCATLIIVKRQR